MSASSEANVIRARLQSIVGLIEQHRATLGLLERERLQLQMRLRLTGYRPPAPKAADG